MRGIMKYSSQEQIIRSEFIVKLHHSTPYEFRRKNAYPKIEDQLDALWKGGLDLEVMKKKVLAVKAKHLKDSI